MKSSPVTRVCLILFIGLCVLCATKILIQDLPRIKACTFKQNDIQPLYLSSRVWSQGRNPYDPAILAREMDRSNPNGFQLMHGRCEEDCQVYYPPTALPVFAIFSILPWTIFLSLYLTACVGVYLFCLFKLSMLLAGTWQKLLFWGLGLAFSPFHAGIGSCNVSDLLIPVVLLCMLWADNVGSAAVIGIVTCIKPPLAILFIGYYVVSGQRRKAAVSIGVVALVSAISLFQLQHTGWLSTYEVALSHFSATADGPGGVADHGIVNLGFLNLQALFYLVTRSARWAVVCDYIALICLYGALLAPLFRREGRVAAAGNHLAMMSALCSITLLQSTLQYYNGIFLLAPALYALRSRSRWVQVAMVAAISTFVLPPKWFMLLYHLGQTSLGEVLHAAQVRGFGAGSQLTYTQELLACIPSLLVALISCTLIATLYTQQRRINS